MIPLSRIVAETKVKLGDPMTPEEELKFLDDVSLLFAGELLERGERECPGFEAFAEYVSRRQMRLTGMRGARA